MTCIRTALAVLVVFCAALVGCSTGDAIPVNYSDTRFVDSLLAKGVPVDMERANPGAMAQTTCDALGRGITADAMAAVVARDSNLDLPQAKVFVATAVETYCPQLPAAVVEGRADGCYNPQADADAVAIGFDPAAVHQACLIAAYHEGHLRALVDHYQLTGSTEVPEWAHNIGGAS